ncbi:MAG: hypothetical protein Q8N23_24060 [Archangium sp.]|nr:hypothetical protein [Archangium sp.]MDP3574011.1 hypothetical protein [Archangium sp.]
MIEFDFRPDEGVLAENAEGEPQAADPAALEETYFVMPLRFSVNGAEVLGAGGEPWWDLPLLGFATHLQACLERLIEQGKAQMFLAGGGSLVWRLRDDAAEVRNSLSGATVPMSLAELHSAVAALFQRVRQFLLTRFPSMVAHPRWTDWFGASL